jgi:hypothetical protein
MKLISNSLTTTIKSTFNLINYGRVEVNNVDTMIGFGRRGINHISNYHMLYFRGSYVAGFFIQNHENLK